MGEGRTEEPEVDATVNPQWMSTPTLVKVNIRMPVDTNDVNTEYEPFWYTGYYNLMTVDNIFEEGEFIQELGMYSIPITDAIDEVADKKTRTEEDKGAVAAIIDSIVNFFTGDDDASEKQTLKSRAQNRSRGRQKASNSIKKEGS